jgi:hypothetical protein
MDGIERTQNSTKPFLEFVGFRGKPKSKTLKLIFKDEKKQTQSLTTINGVLKYVTFAVVCISHLVLQLQLVF